MYCANCGVKIIPDPTNSFSMRNDYRFPVDNNFNLKIFSNECNSAFCRNCGALSVFVVSSVYNLTDEDD